MLTSPHGDGSHGVGVDYKIFAHLWEYYMTGAFGEEVVQYKGFQTKANIDTDIDAGRRVYLGAYRYRAGGEMLIRPDGKKELNITDNNGSVRLVVIQDGTSINTLHYDYKPFGDTLWTSAGTMNRDNFDGSTYDSESDLQMLGFRMYDNETGRFTTPDLLWSAFPAQTPYHYAYNSPMTYRDPTGLAPEKEKEGEELMALFDWSSIQAGLLAVQRFVEEIQNSSKYDPSGVAYEALDPAYEGYGSFGRTAHQNWLTTDIWKRKYEALVALGIIRTYIDYKQQIHVPTSKGYLVMPLHVSPTSMSEYNNITNQLINSFDKMVQADPFFFDPLHGSYIEILIEPGTEIAQHYNSKNGGNVYILPGLHSQNELMPGQTTIRIAKEVFKFEN